MEFVVSDTDRLQARRISLILAAVATAIPLAGLVGWITGKSLLASFGEQFVPMAPGSAVCFILLALTLALSIRPVEGPAGSRGGFIASCLVGAYGFLVFLAWVTGLPINPDAALFKDMGTLGEQPVGLMSPATGGLLSLTALSLMAFIRGSSQERRANAWGSLAGVLGFTVVSIGAVFIFGYTFRTPLLYGGTVIPMPLPGAISFFFLGSCLTTASVFYSPMSRRWYRAFRDIGIGRQFRLAEGVILLFVAILGILAWRQADLLWQQTKIMYEHPLQVRTALGVLESDTLAMSVEIRNMLLADNPEDRQTALMNNDACAVSAERQFEILYELYLGPRADIENACDAYARWVSIRKAAIESVQIGDISKVAKRLQSTGDITAQRIKLEAYIKVIDDFAKNKGDQLYLTAGEQTGILKRRLAVTITAIVLLTLLVSGALRRGIITPLVQLTAIADRFRKGDRQVRSGYSSESELGMLAGSFNLMADTIEEEMAVSRNAAEITRALQEESEAHAFCRGLIKELLRHTGSQMGAVYLLNPQETAFEHFESIGLTENGRVSFSAIEPEGEFGAALAAGRMQRITDIPADPRFTLATVGGSITPREIITIPLLTDHETSAVLSLSSVRGFDPAAVRLLEEITGVMTARMNGVLAYRKILDLADRLELQNMVLGDQKQELASQSEELRQTVHELQAQATEIALQSRQLEEANRLKSEFLSNMSHELRTPLNSVMALSQVLTLTARDRLTLEEANYLTIIERNGRHLLSLINDILDLSKIEAGRMDVTPAEFSIGKTLRAIMENLEPLAEGKGIRLMEQIPDTLPRIESDEARVHQILQNIIGNAVKFTHEGNVIVSASSDGDKVSVRVEDTGIGISEQNLPHIFDEFRQVDGSSSRKYEGTGLGLAIARKASQLLGGVIEVESTLGKGTAFKITFPIRWEGSDIAPIPFAQGYPEAIQALEPDAAGPAGSGNDPRTLKENMILLVEDNESAVIQVKSVLEQEGFHLETARNGQEALGFVTHSIPGGIILDLMMPGIDGFEVLEKLRGTQATAHIPVLILTAKDLTREDLARLRSNHVQQLIQKGDVDREALLLKTKIMMGLIPEKKAGPSVEAKKSTQPRKKSDPLGKQGRPTILVVEDNADNMITLKALLQNRYTLIEATDGEAGVTAALAGLPDLILLDMSLPGMDGFQVVRELKEDEKACWIPVIALTARAMKGDREEIVTAGCDDYISKPVDSGELIGKIEMWLTRNREG